MAMPRIFTKEEVRIAEHFALELAASIKGRIASVAIDRIPLPASELVKSKHLIPLVVLIDDLSKPLSDQDVRAYLQITARLVHTISKQLHVSTLKLSEHWDRLLLRVPQHMDLVRYGVSVYDKGFFDPVHQLVTKGRLRPSFESEAVYITRADATLKNSTGHVVQATLDLYWAAIDACHAGLMKFGQVPPEPADMAKRLEEVLVSKQLLEPEFPKIMFMLYELSRDILHKNITEIAGQDYDHYYGQTLRIVQRMEQLVG